MPRHSLSQTSKRYPHSNHPSSWPQSLVVIGSHSGHVVCAEAATGRVCWSTTLPDRVDSSAALFPSPSGRHMIAVGCYDGGLYLLSAETGLILERLECGGQVKCSPATDPSTGLLWIGSHGGKLLAVEAVENGPRLAQVVFTFSPESAKPFFSSPLPLPQGLVLAADLAGRLFCFESTPPFRLKWTHQHPAPIFASLTPASPQFTSSPSPPPSTSIYFGSVDGSLNEISVDSGQLLMSIKAGGPIFSTPSAQSDSILFGCHDSRLYSFTPSSGAITSRPLPGPAYCSPFRVRLAPLQLPSQVNTVRRFHECFLLNSASSLLGSRRR